MVIHSASTSYSSSANSTITSNCSSDDGLTGLQDVADIRGPGHRTQVPIAIVGMSCRLPGHSSSPTALWDFLQRGGVAKNEPPASRFNLAGHYDKTRRARTMKSPGGMFMEDVDPAVFDGQFFNINRVDCIAMDPQQRQLLEVTYECLENAGIPLQTLNGSKTGVIVGANFIDYAAVQNRDPEDRADSITIGLATSILSNRISHFLNLNGPSMTLDTACSASLVSVDVACRYLDSFQADGMIVGGANMWLTPEHNEEIGMMHMTQSASGKCHSFDEKADGYVKAEGINIIYLKRLDDAIRDNDPIRAVIRGTASNASGRTAGLANPSADAQAAVTRMAYKNAGISDFRATQFLECHGTGTLAGDPIEVKGAASVFGAGRSDGQELVIGSIKSNIGHSEAAAGLSGLIKATLAVEHGIIPGNPTFTKPNPKIDFKASRIRVSRTSVKWPSGASIRRASVNSFGFGGANAHAVIENAITSPHISSFQRVTKDFFDDEDDEEEKEEEGGTERTMTPKVLVFSANDPLSLQNYIKALSSHLLNPVVSIDIEDLAYTLSQRRSQHYCRAFSVTRSSKGLLDEETIMMGKQAPLPPRIGLVFTGQGAQWSQMGSNLVRDFPFARKVIGDLDKVLQTVEEPPQWSLLEELTAARSSEVLRQPEFSQPLVTALQLALLEVLNNWGIRPHAVVGHSSGEIAAAAAAGLITYADAIKTAFYRGQAAKKVVTSTEPVGMLAVGVSPDKIKKYLQSEEGNVQIACYNSPDSLTMSGTVAALESLRIHLQADGHFARMLLVDLAYHSQYMREIGVIYEQMLLRDQLFHNQPSSPQPDVQMFSSVLGRLMQADEKLDAAYWKKNMVSPVQFTQATSEMLRNVQFGANFLIELGPSNALSGPIAQIKKNISDTVARDTVYVSALKRGADSTLAMYQTAGQLYLAGGTIDLSKVNMIDKHSAKLIVDLPNYAWNHSNRYWHETRASKDWRFKKFVNHDLLGSKVPGTDWRAPLFKKVLKVANVPWLRDHKLGSEIVFPAAAYVSMAVEAMYQTAMSTHWDHQVPTRYRFRLKNVQLLRALVLEENGDVRLTLALTPIKGCSTRSWYEYRVCSVQESLQNDPVHSTGLVCVETNYQVTNHQIENMEPLDLPTPAHVWYKALADLGYNFGPCFRKHLMVEATIGKRNTRSTVNLEPPPSIPLGQSYYPIHPAVMDSCFQTGSPSLWNCEPPTSGGTVLVPKIIDSIVVEANRDLPTEGIALSSAKFVGVGNAALPRNYATSVKLFDPRDGTFLFEMEGLHSGEIEMSDIANPAHTFTRLAWDADVDMLMATSNTVAVQQWLRTKELHDVFNMIAHKTPGLSLLELNLNPEDVSSLWLEETDRMNHIRTVCSQYHVGVRDPKAVFRAAEQMASQVSSSQIHVVDTSKAAAVVPGIGFDLAIVKTNPQTRAEAGIIIKSLALSLRPGAYVITIGIDDVPLRSLGQTVRLRDNIHLCHFENRIREGAHPNITHVSLLDLETQRTCDMAQVIDALRANQWVIQTSSAPLNDIKSSTDVVVIIDELFSSVMDSLEERQWDVLKYLAEKRCRLLWVTAGAHLSVTDPTKAAIAGLIRAIRAEEQLSFMTLDVESATGNATNVAISLCLEWLCVSDTFKRDVPRDSEFVERGGIIYTSRLVPDAALTALQSDHVADRPTDITDLHACKALVQLRCERLGNLDSLHFDETLSNEVPLPNGLLEVKVCAAGLNYKDVVVSMGTVPGDESQLGHEAAGVVTQISPGISDFKVGDRVVVFGKGCFANLIRTTPSRAYRIPDNVSFEEAATLAVVYLTSIYSLFDQGNLSAGKTVLIHSAAGGVGIAAIQLAQYAGADVFVTVGTPEKRHFLQSTFGLSDNRVFGSRNTDFGDQILAVTNGRGVDVVLNSLTGDMLDESFRILADGGIMVEIGKKDILERNSLSMRPFDRNISFRAVDLSPERTPDALVARLMSKLFKLLIGGHIKPIKPMHCFSWAEVPSAFRFLRPGTHIGKVVLSDDPDIKIQVPIRRAPPKLHFRDDGCYMIVGGLRGLCGSLAVYLAKTGAKFLAVISRSGYLDDKSQRVIKQIKALGAYIDLLTIDVTKAIEVKNAFKQTTKPVAGIIQGAMVLRDRAFDQMTLAEYHEAIQCKIRGTWNLHNAAESLSLNLDFFTLLSSISGIIGNRGQANYAAANTFLDAFAAFRHSRGQAACSVDLGVIEDAGVIAENTKLQAQFDGRIFRGINDGLLRKIVGLSVLQQESPAPSPAAQTQIITGLITPQPSYSSLKRDARFSALFTSDKSTDDGDSGAKRGNTEVQIVLMMLRTESIDVAAKLNAVVDLVNASFMRILQLPEPMDPARPLSVYGIDSLAAVELRNWVRTELGALVTTLDVLNASSLNKLGERIIAKIIGE
ncbi:PKSKA1 [Patellaria atrata CBS 101060]|uniref:PKSKA1 n=1 Tax=Patellaria atrata CBS 101060 TaxID=1346257 RepID=A0A9P4SFV4_9PEZI|nr:PKSKA1 [Patellaria atrata CBS 101060]